MSRSVTLKGAEVKLYINGKSFPEVHSINYTIDYGDSEIYGIDSPFPQEIAPGKIAVQGTVSGVKIKGTGGLQGYEIRTKINEVLHSPYTSLKLHDRNTDESILWLPQMKVVSESVQIASKGTVRFSFTFKGIIPFNTLDVHK